MTNEGIRQELKILEAQWLAEATEDQLSDKARWILHGIRLAVRKILPLLEDRKAA